MQTDKTAIQNIEDNLGANSKDIQQEPVDCIATECIPNITVSLEHQLNTRGYHSTLDTITGPVDKQQPVDVKLRVRENGVGSNDNCVVLDVFSNSIGSGASEALSKPVGLEVSESGELRISAESAASRQLLVCKLDESPVANETGSLSTKESAVVPPSEIYDNSTVNSQFSIDLGNDTILNMKLKAVEDISEYSKATIDNLYGGDLSQPEEAVNQSKQTVSTTRGYIYNWIDTIFGNMFGRNSVDPNDKVIDADSVVTVDSAVDSDNVLAVDSVVAVDNIINADNVATVDSVVDADLNTPDFQKLKSEYDELRNSVGNICNVTCQALDDALVGLNKTVAEHDIDTVTNTVRVSKIMEIPPSPFMAGIYNIKDIAVEGITEMFNYVKDGLMSEYQPADIKTLSLMDPKTASLQALKDTSRFYPSRMKDAAVFNFGNNVNSIYKTIFNSNTVGTVTSEATTTIMTPSVILSETVTSQDEFFPKASIKIPTAETVLASKTVLDINVHETVGSQDEFFPEAGIKIPATETVIDIDGTFDPELATVSEIVMTPILQNSTVIPDESLVRITNTTVAENITNLPPANIDIIISPSLEFSNMMPSATLGSQSIAETNGVTSVTVVTAIFFSTVILATGKQAITGYINSYKRVKRRLRFTHLMAIVAMVGIMAILLILGVIIIFPQYAQKVGFLSKISNKISLASSS